MSAPAAPTAGARAGARVAVALTALTGIGGYIKGFSAAAARDYIPAEKYEGHRDGYELVSTICEDEIRGAHLFDAEFSGRHHLDTGALNSAIRNKLANDGADGVLFSLPNGTKFVFVNYPHGTGGGKFASSCKVLIRAQVVAWNGTYKLYLNNDSLATQKAQVVRLMRAAGWTPSPGASSVFAITPDQRRAEAERTLRRATAAVADDDSKAMFPMQHHFVKVVLPYGARAEAAGIRAGGERKRRRAQIAHQQVLCDVAVEQSEQQQELYSLRAQRSSARADARRSHVHLVRQRAADAERGSGGETQLGSSSYASAVSHHPSQRSDSPEPPRPGSAGPRHERSHLFRRRFVDASPTTPVDRVHECACDQYGVDVESTSLFAPDGTRMREGTLGDYAGPGCVLDLRDDDVAAGVGHGGLLGMRIGEASHPGPSSSRPASVIVRESMIAVALWCTMAVVNVIPASVFDSLLGTTVDSLVLGTACLLLTSVCLAGTTARTRITASTRLRGSASVSGRLQHRQEAREERRKRRKYSELLVAVVAFFLFLARRRVRQVVALIGRAVEFVITYRVLQFLGVLVLQVVTSLAAYPTTV
eukprot:gene36403-15540_t